MKLQDFGSLNGTYLNEKIIGRHGLLDREMRACVDIIRDNRPRMDRLVTALLNKNKLTAREIEEALK